MLELGWFGRHATFATAMVILAGCGMDHSSGGGGGDSGADAAVHADARVSGGTTGSSSGGGAGDGAPAQ